MILKHFVNLTVLALILTCAGCATFDEHPRRAVQEREDMLRLDEKINRMNGRLEALELEQRQVSFQIEQTRHASSSAALEQASALKTRMDDLEKRIQALDAAREADKQQIVGTITKKLIPYLSQPQGRPTRAASGPAGTHEVQSGETLSKIASDYGVSINELMSANSIENPNKVLQGQKLVIPKR